MVRKNNLKNTASAAIVTLCAFGVTTSAWATDGYFQNGVGTRHKALAGSGTADAKDATALSINPAGLVHAGHELAIAASIFTPDRGFVGSGGPGFTPNGSANGNDTGFFILPDISYSRPLNDKATVAFSITGNGGLNTDFENTTNPACFSPPLPANNGVFCGGDTGVNLVQVLISAGYAYDFGKWSVGIAPILAVQTFKAKGLSAFGGVSSNPTKLSNNGFDTSYGGGVRLGVEVEATDNLRFGASYQSKLYMTEFDDYAGLFADQGDFDIPQTVNIGVAADISPKLTVLLDYRWINYEGVNSVSNSTTTPLPFGASNGPGFGWEDLNAVKLGIEWKPDDVWTVRGGFSTNNSQIGPEDVTLNIVAPGAVTDHYTFGFEKKMPNGNAIEVGFMYAPEQVVTGIEVTPQGPNPGHLISISLEEIELTAGWKFSFGK